MAAGNTAPHHNNSLGFFRLTFASLVIVSHMAELADGDRRREILTRIFGTLSCGEIAVTGFFLISGYLITSSFLHSSSTFSYLKKRTLRIYPAFIVAFLICIFLVAPLGGAPHFPFRAYAHEIVRLIALLPPDLPAFAGSHFPVLDGAMWTIAYEFRCYILVILLGMIGAFRRRWTIPGLAALCLILFHVLPPGDMARLEKIPYSDLVVGGILPDLRFIGIFLIGASFYLFKDHIRFSRLATAIAFVTMVIALSIPTFVDTSFALAEGFFIFGVASFTGHTVLGRINNDDDISYGVYLYGWPLSKLVLWWWPGRNLLAAGVLTFLAACLCGWLSWRFVEAPVMRLFRRPTTDESGLDDALLPVGRRSAGS